MEKLSGANNAKQNSKPKWDWMQVDCNLKTESNRKYVMWSLAPSIVLTSPSGEGPDPNVKLYVDTEKSLQFSEQLGWNWHKSWNLPNISIRVEIKDVATGQSLLAPKNLFAQLFAVKVVVDPHDKNDNAHLVDVGIRGTSKIEMVDGQAYFTAIKFLSTSYNNEGVKFYLLLLLYINPTDNETPKILTATLSPPIFVDSRKSARDNQQKKYTSFIEPFLVENIDKDFIKRENRRKNENEIKIRNDFEGLFNYLTAPNIRHKVKHPVFLAIKFSACAKLFFNTNLIPKTTPLNEMLNVLQKKISKDHSSRRCGKTQIKNDDKAFLLTVSESSDSYKNKKVQESIDSLECASLGIIYNAQELPAFFENIITLGNLANAYRDEYSQLYLIAKSIINIDAEDYKNGSGESDSGSEGNESEEDEYDSPIQAKPVKQLKKKKYSDDDEESERAGADDVKREGGVNVAQDLTSLLKRQQPISVVTPKNAVSDQNKQSQQDQKEQNTSQKATRAEAQSQQPSQTQPFTPAINGMAGMAGMNANQQFGVSMQQAMLNNFLMSNQMKMAGGYPNSQQPNMMGFGQMGSKGMGMQNMMQQPDILGMLAGMNPMMGLAGLQGLSVPGMMPSNTPPAQQTSAPKSGFTTINPPSQQPCGGSQQLQPGSQQNTLLLLQQLAMYRDILAQLAYPGQMNGMGMLNGLQAMSGGLSQGMQLPQIPGMPNMGQQIGAGGNMPNMGGMGGMGMPFPGFNYYGGAQGMQSGNPGQTESQEKKIYDAMRMMQMQQQPQEPPSHQTKQQEQ